VNSIRRLTIAGAVACACAALSGCIGFHGPNDLRRSVASANNVRLKQNVGFSTNGMTLRMAKGLASPWVDQPLPKLKGIRRAQFGTYKIEPRSGFTPESMLRDFQLKGWTPAVRVTNPKGADETLVLVKEDRKGRLRGVVVAARDNDEITLARVRGDLDTFLANVLADDSFGIDIPYLGVAPRDHNEAAADIARREIRRAEAIAERARRMAGVKVPGRD